MVTREQVELRAYRIWQEAGCPDGSSLAHWLQAEIELGVVPDPRASDPIVTLHELAMEAAGGAAADDELQASVDSAVPEREPLPRGAAENPMSEHVAGVAKGEEPRPGPTTFEGGDRVRR